MKRDMGYQIAHMTDSGPEIVELDKSYMDDLLCEISYSSQRLDIPEAAFSRGGQAEGTETLLLMNKQLHHLAELSNEYRNHITNGTAVLIEGAMGNVVNVDQVSGQEGPLMETVK